ncbi:MAG: ACT domain-containing protein [Phycisphaerales bacterium]
MNANRRLSIERVPGAFAVCRLPAGAGVAEWGGWGAGEGAGEFWTVSGTRDEVSVTCAESRVPAGIRATKGFALLRLSGEIPFSETGVIAAIAGPLAEARISLVPIATYDTDYFLVQQADLARAVAVLRAAGHTLHGL